MDNIILDLLPEIIDNHDSGLILVDSNYKTKIINNWIVEHANLDKNKVLNKNILTLFPEIENQRLHIVITEALTKNRVSILSQAIHRSPLPIYQDSVINGNRKIMQQRITVKPLKAKGNSFCLLQIFDMSAAVAKESLLIATATKARISKEQAESLSKIKSEFVSTISHELRTPLTSISGSVGLILGGATGNINSETTKMLNIVHRNSNRLIKLINELLDIQKIESGTVEYKFEDKKLKPLIKNCIEMNNAFAEKFKIKYQFLKCKEDYDVFIDEERISQVILNLLSNATKFSDQNSIVTIELEQSKNTIRTIVSDTGPGIPDNFKNKIFTKFAQVNSDDNRAHAGSGLGLCICKSIIEHHNGAISYYNNDKGAAFYFDLPLDKSNKPTNNLI